jgi:ribose transport system permease protein
MKSNEKSIAKPESKALKFIKDNNIIFILILVFIAAALIASPALGGGKTNNFLKASNLSNLLQIIGTYGVLAMGLTFVFLVGGIDLSIGYQVAFCAAVFATMMNAGVPVVLGMIITLALGCLIGYVNGTIVTRLGIPSLIGTLAVMTFLKGCVYLLNSSSISLNGILLGGTSMKDLYNAGAGIFTLPVILIIILLIVFTFFLRQTVPGSNLYVVGGNYEAGLLAGINPDRLTRVAYSLGGVCSALCALLLAMRMNSATYNMGDGIDITAICAVVVGGIKMQGGKGNMAMCIMGVAVIQIITNVMDKLHYSTAIVSLVTGIVVILVLIIDKFTSSKDVTQ